MHIYIDIYSGYICIKIFILFITSERSEQSSLYRCVRIYNTVRGISRKRVSWSGRVGSSLEMDSRHKNKKIYFHPRSLRPF